MTLRKIVDLINNQLILTLPESFIGKKKVLVTIEDDFETPKELENTGQISEFQKFLLTGPIMTDEQYNYVQEKRKHFGEWK